MADAANASIAFYASRAEIASRLYLLIIFQEIYHSFS